MPRKYDNNFKAMIVNLICNEKHSTIKTAQQFDIPLKTLEKWITAFNKDNHCFDSDCRYLSQSTKNQPGNKKAVSFLKPSLSNL